MSKVQGDALLARPKKPIVRLSARFRTDDDLIADLVRVAQIDNRSSITRLRYDEEGDFHSSTLARRLGGWPAACSRAGLETGRSDLGHSDGKWFQNIFDVWISKGAQPSYGDKADEVL
jgi:hypothetical protein